MIRRASLLSCALLVALSGSSPVAGQDPDPPTQPPARDPFQAADVEATVVDELPPVALGGVVLMKDRPALALLRLAEQAYVVRVGAVLNVDAQGRRVRARTASGAPVGVRRVRLRVSAIDRDGVTLQVGDSDVEVVVR